MNNKQTFLDVISDYNKKLGHSINLFSKVLVWTVDYEKGFYLIYDEIPEAANWFWVNRFGTYLYKFEKEGKEWKVVEKASSLNEKGLRRIRTGPSFDRAPILLNPPKVASWF